MDDAWGVTGTGVKLWHWTGYVNAQTWDIVPTNNPEPSYHIVTRLSSDLVFGADNNRQLRLFDRGNNANQIWHFIPINT